MRSGASEGRIFVEKGKSTLENGKKHYTFAQIREWFRMLAGLLRRFPSGDKAQSEDAAQTKKTAANCVVRRRGVPGKCRMRDYLRVRSSE